MTQPSGIYVNHVTHLFELLLIAPATYFATCRSACSEGCSSSYLRNAVSSAGSSRFHNCLPQEAVDVCASRLRAASGIRGLLVQLVYTCIDAARDIRLGGTIQIFGWIVNHVREQAVGVEDTCHLVSRRRPTIATPMAHQYVRLSTLAPGVAVVLLTARYHC